MQLSRFPRVKLGHFPTPLEPLPRLTNLLGGPKLYIKRDDCSGLATGGNKTRKLEFVMADALARGADTVITQGAVQSNHARQTAAAAAKLGMRCRILLENRTGSTKHEYCESGNVLLDHLLGAPTQVYPAGTDMNQAMEETAMDVRRDGGTPYIIPGGASNPTGALGYVDGAMELLNQANAAGITIDHVVHATGSSGTQAGLVTGFDGCHSGIQVLGIGVRAPREKQETAVFELALATADMLDTRNTISRNRIVANCDYVGEGYGMPTREMAEAVALVAQMEGILLDPVYSGKGMAGLLDLIKKQRFSKNDTVVFLHTGGSAGLFGYRDAFSAVAARHHATFRTAEKAIT